MYNAGKNPIKLDPYLQPFAQKLGERTHYIGTVEHRLTRGVMDLSDFAAAHEYYGLHRSGDQWIFREWAPNADSIHLIGDFNEWRVCDNFAAHRITDDGQWELRLSADAMEHGQSYRLMLTWPGGSGERIPAYARSVVFSPETNTFNARIWRPSTPYSWNNEALGIRSRELYIYESHVGIASEEPRVAGYREFAEDVLPRIARAGYNCIQLMAVQEHPYYGSFGYHVSNFYAPSSRFGTPDDLKYLVDSAHALDIGVIIDLVHSHATKNDIEGIGRFDGTHYQYFHEGGRGYHEAWDSYCFDYGKNDVIHFLLSNCRYWLDEFRVDGFRFDGVTSMLYNHRGLGHAFASYDEYFNNVDADALAYLALANKLIHELRPGAVTIAEDVSGMPALTSSIEFGGCDFDYRLCMGIPDFWFEVLKRSDEDWSMDELYHRIVDHRPEERVVNYAESHDQAIVGGKTLIFEMIDAEMYTGMHRDRPSEVVQRGIALHKMIRLATMAGGGSAYLNFIGNEFGHPEWLDFPREGNNWSYHYARRQWSLLDDPELLFMPLANFDRDMLECCRQHSILSQRQPQLRYSHDDDKVVAWMRGDICFIFNWHPTKSFPDYPIPLPSGRYELLTNTDSAKYGGHGRLAEKQEYCTTENEDGSTAILAYIPCRTGLVLIKQRR